MSDKFVRPKPIIWSQYQKDIFRDIAKGEGHTIIIARAGSSKTTVLVEGSKYIPKGKKSLFCAFNKHIQKELRSRLGKFIECRTLHSLGFQAIKNRFGANVEVNNNKCWEIVERLVGDNFDLIQSLCKTISLCKANLVDSPSKIDELIAYYDIDICEIDLDKFIKYVILSLGLCKEKTNIVDYDDMVWFPFIYRLNVGKYDFVCADEAQDFSKCQIELVLSAIKYDGRLIIVMDNKQAIYTFAGADSRVLDNIKSRIDHKELKLPICYRCPKKVVELAQTIVPDILPYEKSPDGEIIDLNINDLQKYAKPGSYVLSRTNAPLIKHCMRFLKNNIPANILGRDIGENLLYLIKKSKKKKVSDFLKWLVQWEKQEKENLLAKYPKASTEVIADKAECLSTLCEDASSIEEIKENINALFKENNEKDIVLFSTVHKIKGKETNDVFVLCDTLRSHTEEEYNIQYISFTRAKQRLYLVKKELS